MFNWQMWCIYMDPERVLSLRIKFQHWTDVRPCASTLQSCTFFNSKVIWLLVCLPSFRVSATLKWVVIDLDNGLSSIRHHWNPWWLYIKHTKGNTQKSKLIQIYLTAFFCNPWWYHVMKPLALLFLCKGNITMDQECRSSIGRVFRSPLRRRRKMAALPLPVAILDDLICGNRKWGHPRWRPEAEGPPFSSASAIGVEKPAPGPGWRHFRRRHLGSKMATVEMTSGGRRDAREDVPQTSAPIHDSCRSLTLLKASDR